MDVILPDSPLDVHLRRIHVDDDRSGTEPATKKSSKIQDVIHRFKLFIFLLYSIVYTYFVFAPWRVVESWIAESTLSYCIDRDIIHEEESNHIMTEFARPKRIGLYAAVVVGFSAMLPWWQLWLLGILIFTLPLTLNCLLYRYILSCNCIRLAKSLRRCSNLFTEIHVVQLSLLRLARSDLVKELSSQQIQSLARHLRQELIEVTSELRELVDNYFSSLTLQFVKLRRLTTSSDPVEICASSSETAHIRKLVSLASLRLFDVTVSSLRSIFVSSWRWDSLFRLFCSHINFTARLFKLNRRLENAAKLALHSDLQGSLGQIEQFSDFVYKCKGDPIDKEIFKYFTNLVLVNKLSTLINNENVTGEQVDDLIVQLKSSLSHLEKFKISKWPTKLVTTEQHLDMSSKTTPNQKQSIIIEEPESLLNEDLNDELQLYFADTATDEEDTFGRKRQGLEKYHENDLQKSPANFLTELQSVLLERTRETEQKEREILKRKGIDLDDVLAQVNASDTVKKPEALPKVVLDRETLGLRAALISDFKEQKHIIFPKMAVEEFIHCDESD